MTPKEQLEKILENPVRFFYHPSFDDPKEIKNILAEMPEYEKFKNNNENIAKTQKIAVEMRPCYEAVLLTTAQEQHLFKKMSYYRYKAKCLLAVNPDKVTAGRIEKIETLLKKAIEIRNEIATSNFRLATQILKMQITFYREHSLLDSLLSDAYFDVLKAVDYFNWTLGNKFSTYATWVVKKNFFRDSKQKISQSEKLTVLNEEHSQKIVSKESGFLEEKEQDEKKATIQKLLDMLKDSENGDRKRQSFVLENYFGVNGRERKNLEEISEMIGVTKERVRQLKEKGLLWIRNKVSELGLEEIL